MQPACGLVLEASLGTGTGCIGMQPMAGIYISEELWTDKRTFLGGPTIYTLTGQLLMD